MLKDHSGCLFDDVLFRIHPGPQRQLPEHPHELASRRHPIAALDDALRSQTGEIALEPLRLRPHDGGELLGIQGRNRRESGMSSAVPRVPLLTPVSAAETETIGAARFGSFDQLSELGRMPEEESDYGMDR